MRCAVVLAGGRSVRMGRAKASLRWGQTSMLEHVVARLRPACERIVVVGHAGQPLPLPPDVRRVDDPAALDDQGPLVGAVTGLATLDQSDAVYLAAVDKPNLSDEHVRFVLAALDDHDAVVPRSPSRLHPLAAAVRAGPALAAGRSLVAEGERALKRIFGALDRVRYLELDELPDPAVLADCNTPAEYEALRARR